MPRLISTTNLSPGLLVTSIKALTRSILFSMGLDHVLLEFFVRAAAGAASVVIVILFVGIGIPRHSSLAMRRTKR